MAFVNDGSVHYSGIKNEERICEKLNNGCMKTVLSHLSSGAVASQRGGTKYKEDIVVSFESGEVLISVKNKSKGLHVGSFDWVNSSSAIRNSTTGIFRQVQETVSNLRNSTKSKESAREIFNRSSYNTLISLTAQQVKDILQQQILHKYSGMKLVISDGATGKDYFIEFDKTEIARAIQDYTPNLVFGSGTTSAKIIFSDLYGDRYDYGLRIRLVTNNGIGALLNPMKNSIAVIKVQQDKVSDLIDRNMTNNNCITF